MKKEIIFSNYVDLILKKCEKKNLFISFDLEQVEYICLVEQLLDNYKFIDISLNPREENCNYKHMYNRYKKLNADIINLINIDENLNDIDIKEDEKYIFIPTNNLCGKMFPESNIGKSFIKSIEYIYEATLTGTSSIDLLEKIKEICFEKTI